jgi:Trm5-related predicted tRNA methylase
MNELLSDKETDDLITKIFETYQDQRDFYFVLSHEEQAKILDTLLNSYNSASEISRKKIADTTSGILKEFCAFFNSFVEVLIRHLEKEPVHHAILAMTPSGIFCETLMKSLVKKNIRISSSLTWRKNIEDNISGKKFNETFLDTDLKRMYQNLEDLIKKI